MIVLLNGPPRSGKDAIADMICANNKSFTKLRFKDALVESVSKSYNVSTELIELLLVDERTKEHPLPEFNGLTCRQAMIDESENKIKPKWGKAYFGLATASKMNLDSNYVLSDAGFMEEAQVLIDEFGLDNIVLIQIERAGCDFSNDSRSYLPVENFKYSARLTNNKTIEDFYEKVTDFLDLVEWRKDNANK